MRFLLDTNACIACLRGRPQSVAERLKQLRPDEVVVCSVVRAELLFGAARSTRREHSELAARALLAPFESLPFDDRAADIYGPLRALLGSRGHAIGPNDLIIASIAMANGLTLVTHNVAEFSRVEGLSIEDWEA